MLIKDNFCRNPNQLAPARIDQKKQGLYVGFRIKCWFY
ncbi:MAG: hypothetical protein ACI8YP_002675 [Algoriphagus sp.]|jgi:hypothetical protein